MTTWFNISEHIRARGKETGYHLCFFNLVVDALAALIENAQEQSIIKGLVSEYVEGGLVILQYANGTVFLLEGKREYARNLKFILCLFEQRAGLKINFYESEVCCFGEADNGQNTFEEIFTCKRGGGGASI